MDKIQRAYKTHKDGAKRRGIEFLFTFEQWVDWWEQALGPDWPKMRGHGYRRYVMARNGDCGPYSPSNVRCLTDNENRRDQTLNGRDNGGLKKITAAQAREIYFAIGTQKSIADQYGISPRLVRLIKKRQVWQRVLPRE